MDNKSLDQLEQRINNIKASNSASTKPKTSGTGFLALNVAIELLAGVLVGLIVGLLFDKIFGTKPLFLISCLLIGIAASIKPIWKRIKEK